MFATGLTSWSSVMDHRPEGLPSPGDLLKTYNSKADDFIRLRSQSLMEAHWLDTFLRTLPKRPDILDVGCGSGRPIGAYLIARGCSLTGIDGSPALIDDARSHLPKANWRVEDMRYLKPSPQTYDGIIAWHSLFHLRPFEHGRVLKKLTRLLRPGGAFMFTTAPVAGKVTGFIGQTPVYHGAVSEYVYRHVLSRCGLKLVSFVRNDPDCGSATVALARKTRKLR